MCTFLAVNSGRGHRQVKLVFNELACSGLVNLCVASVASLSCDAFLINGVFSEKRNDIIGQQLEKEIEDED